MNYQQKKKIADQYLMLVCGLGWDDLSDINSLHDCETQEDIIDACQERLGEDTFPLDLLEI